MPKIRPEFHREVRERPDVRWPLRMRLLFMMGASLVLWGLIAVIIYAFAR